MTELNWWAKGPKRLPIGNRRGPRPRWALRTRAATLRAGILAWLLGWRRHRTALGAQQRPGARTNGGVRTGPKRATDNQSIQFFVIAFTCGGLVLCNCTLPTDPHLDCMLKLKFTVHRKMKKGTVNTALS